MDMNGNEVIINPFIGGLVLTYVWGALSLHWAANGWPAWRLGALSMIVVPRQHCRQAFFKGLSVFYLRCNFELLRFNSWSVQVGADCKWSVKGLEDLMS